MEYLKPEFRFGRWSVDKKFEFRCLGLILLIVVVIFSVPCKKNGQGQLGIVVPVGEGEVSKYNPYVVTGVYQSSPADRAGVKPDDIIVQINDVPLEGLKHSYIYQQLLRGEPGTEVVIHVERDGKREVIRVTRGG